MAPPAVPVQGPDEIDYEEGDQVPPGYTAEYRVQKGLVIAGAVTLGSVWVINVLAAGVGMAVTEEQQESDSGSTDVEPEAWAPLIAPVVGPLIAMGTLEAEDGGLAVLAVDAAVQAGGLAMLIIGLVQPDIVLVRNAESGVSVEVTPEAAHNANGIGIKGTF